MLTKIWESDSKSQRRGRWVFKKIIWRIGLFSLLYTVIADLKHFNNKYYNTNSLFFRARMRCFRLAVRHKLVLLQWNNICACISIQFYKGSLKSHIMMMIIIIIIMCYNMYIMLSADLHNRTKLLPLGVDEERERDGEPKNQHSETSLLKMF